MSDDHARPIPRGTVSADDDVYTVDTRRRGRSPAAGRVAARGGAAPAAAPPVDDGTRYDEYGRPLPAAGRAAPPPPPVGPAGRGRTPRGPGRRPGGRTVLRGVLLVLALWLVFLVATPVHAWSTVSRVDDVPSGERPAQGDGHTYLLVGSDSREGLTAEQRRRLGTGSAAGRRTDTIILVHVPSGAGKSALISIPRDSFLPIPGNGENKVNAAFAIGGPQLLVRTLEQATGVRIDGYLEIGFGGFAGVVDSLDGVDICVPRAIDDEKAHINLRAGCQTLDGTTALGYVRARYSDPQGDLGRAQRQRQFLGAVMEKAATPSTVLLPWRWWGFTHSAAEGVTIGEETGLTDAGRVALAMRGVSTDETLSLVVPVSDANASTSAGSSVLWDEEQAADLFRMLNEGTPLEEPPPGTQGPQG